MMENYLEQIHEARSEDDLNRIIEMAAFDDLLSHAQYAHLYSAAMSKFYTL